MTNKTNQKGAGKKAAITDQDSQPATTAPKRPSPDEKAVADANNPPAKEPVHTVPLDAIVLDADTQARPLHDDVVAEYRESWQQKAKFPPVMLFDDGKRLILADGFHRVQSAKLAGLGQLAAKIREGDRIAALKHALKANRTHGLRRSIEDKHFAVDRALEEFGDISDREIATLCSVSHPLVAERRKLRPIATGKSSSCEEKRKGKDGKQRRMPRRSKPAGAQPASEDASSAGAKKSGASANVAASVTGSEGAGQGDQDTTGSGGAGTAAHPQLAGNIAVTIKERWRRILEMLAREYAECSQADRAWLAVSLQGQVEQWKDDQRREDQKKPTPDSPQAAADGNESQTVATSK